MNHEPSTVNREPTTSHDAIIIGGGPGGAMTALLLARQGWRVAVVERRERHKAKTCGHCLDGRANAVLQNAELLGDVRGIAVGAVQNAMIYLQGAPPLKWRMGGRRAEPSLLVQRSKFDQLLLDRASFAGACVYQPAAAKVCSIAPGRCIIRVDDHTLHAPLLIGADGLRSRVAHAAGLTDSQIAGRKYGFSFQLPCAEQVELARGVTHMFVTDGGYLGIVHDGNDRLHIAALVGKGHSRSPAAFVDHVRGEFPSLGSMPVLDMHDLTAAGPMPSCASAVANESVALVGDAAGYVEPFTGEGMTWALQSAQLLANVTERTAPGRWTAQAAAHYRQRWRQHIARRQRFCRTLAWTLERRRLVRPLLAITRRQPVLARCVQKVLAA